MITVEDLIKADAHLAQNADSSIDVRIVINLVMAYPIAENLLWIRRSEKHYRNQRRSPIQIQWINGMCQNNGCICYVVGKMTFSLMVSF